MKKAGEAEEQSIRLFIDPGACRMMTTVVIQRHEDRQAVLGSLDSECERIQNIPDFLGIVSFKDLFLPVSNNPIFIAAGKAKLHPSCPVPVAILKGMEAVLGMAVPRDVLMSFQTD